jgi:hypothetical protein
MIFVKSRADKKHIGIQNSILFNTVVQTKCISFNVHSHLKMFQFY